MNSSQSPTGHAKKTAKKTSQEQRLLLATLDRLQSIEQRVTERLTRVEENLHLLRRDLLGNGQPGRLRHLEIELDQLRAEAHRQRGILAGISFVVSTVITLLSQFLFH